LGLREEHDQLTKIANKRRTPTVDHGARVIRKGVQ